jgi:hypothetical protein
LQYNCFHVFQAELLLDLARSAFMKMQNVTSKECQLFAQEMFEGCKGIFGMVDDPCRFDALIGEQVEHPRQVQDTDRTALVETEPQAGVEMTLSCPPAGSSRSRSRRKRI